MSRSTTPVQTKHTQINYTDQTQPHSCSFTTHLPGSPLVVALRLRRRWRLHRGRQVGHKGLGFHQHVKQLLCTGAEVLKKKGQSVESGHQQPPKRPPTANRSIAFPYRSSVRQTPPLTRRTGSPLRAPRRSVGQTACHRCHPRHRCSHRRGRRCLLPAQNADCYSKTAVLPRQQLHGSPEQATALQSRRRRREGLPRIATMATRGATTSTRRKTDLHKPDSGAVVEWGGGKEMLEGRGGEKLQRQRYHARSTRQLKKNRVCKSQSTTAPQPRTTTTPTGRHTRRFQKENSDSQSMQASTASSGIQCVRSYDVMTPPMSSATASAQARGGDVSGWQAGGP